MPTPGGVDPRTTRTTYGHPHVAMGAQATPRRHQSQAGQRTVAIGFQRSVLVQRQNRRSRLQRQGKTLLARRANLLPPHGSSQGIPGGFVELRRVLLCILAIQVLDFPLHLTNLHGQFAHWREIMAIGFEHELLVVLF